MITKKELCETIITKNKINSHTDIPENKILESSNLAVAMEYLGMIKNQQLKEYASQRGGVLICGVTSNGDVKSLTLREILDLLPE